MLREKRGLRPFLLCGILILVVMLLTTDIGILRLILGLKSLKMIEFHLLSSHGAIFLLCHHFVVHLHAQVVGLSKIAFLVKMFLKLSKDSTCLKSSRSSLSSITFLERRGIF